MKISKFVTVWGIALSAGCGLSDDGSARIEVAQGNALGVHSLEIERAGDSSTDVFTLHALSADERELAFVRLSTGEIANLSRSLPGEGDVGSELVLSAQGNDMRSISRETERVTVAVDAVDDLQMAELLELDAVSSTLKREANILVFKRPTAEAAYLPANPQEIAHTFAEACGTSQMLNKPVAQCCSYSEEGNLSPDTIRASTYHVNPDQSTGRRDYNVAGGGAGCKAADGVGACNGAACYFGPFGFSKPFITPKTASLPYGYTAKTRAKDLTDYTWYEACQDRHVATAPTVLYAPITGSQPTNQGCPGSNQGQGFWDY